MCVTSQTPLDLGVTVPFFPPLHLQSRRDAPLFSCIALLVPHRVLQVVTKSDGAAITQRWINSK